MKSSHPKSITFKARARFSDYDGGDGEIVSSDSLVALRETNPLMRLDALHAIGRDLEYEIALADLALLGQMYRASDEEFSWHDVLLKVRREGLSKDFIDDHDVLFEVGHWSGTDLLAVWDNDGHVGKSAEIVKLNPRRKK